MPLLVITIVFGTIYVVAQQVLRLTANDPQVQLAHDLSPQVTGDKLPNAADTGNVDIGSSLAPFVVIYNKDGQAVAGSGYLHGQLPKIPKGVLTSSSRKSDNRVTWEPENGVRIASVTVATKDGHYVVAGRSLQEVEKRTSRILLLVLFGWVLACGLVLINQKYLSRKK